MFEGRYCKSKTSIVAFAMVGLGCGYAFPTALAEIAPMIMVYSLSYERFKSMFALPVPPDDVVRCESLSSKLDLSVDSTRRCEVDGVVERAVRWVPDESSDGSYEQRYSRQESDEEV